MAMSQLHVWRFVLSLVVALLFSGGAWCAPEGWDWSEDAEWQLQTGVGSELRRYSLGLRLDEAGLPSSPQEMVILPSGLLVRYRERRVVNLTVLEGNWTVLRKDAAVAQVGEPWTELAARWGPPFRIYSHPAKKGVIHYYRASLADLGVVVAEGTVQSVMLVEPGFLEGALQRTGYTSPAPAP